MKIRLLAQFSFMVAMVAMIGLFSTGCSREPATGTVSGKVTLDGKPLTKGKIVFTDMQRGVGGSAVLNEDGNYGIVGKLPVGVYKIYFANSIKSGSMDPKDLIFTPVKTMYKSADKSGLEFEIKKGENTANFTLEK